MSFEEMQYGYETLQSSILYTMSCNRNSVCINKLRIHIDDATYLLGMYEDRIAKENKKLERCPLCRGSVYINVFGDEHEEGLEITCDKCGLVLRDKREEDLIKKWNTRKGE